MNRKVTPQDLTNADTVDDLTRRCRELRAENEFVKDQVLALAAHAEELREAYRRNFGMLLAAFGINDDSKTLPTDTGDKYENAFAINHNLILCVKRRMDAALAQPSPLVEAVRAVVEAAVVWEEAEKILREWEVSHIEIIEPSSEHDRLVRVWGKAVRVLRRETCAYLALCDGRDADGGAG